MAELTEQKVKTIVKATVKETMISLGIDACDPIEMQADMLFLNKARKLWGSVLTKVVLLIATATTLGIIGLVTAAIVNAPK